MCMKVIQSNILRTTRFDENSDLSTTWIDQRIIKLKQRSPSLYQYIRTRVYHGKIVR